MLAAGVIAYLIAQIAIAVWAARRVKNADDFWIAGRSLGFVLVSISMFATWFGAETVIGSSSAIATDGLSGGRADPFGYTLCMLLMGLLIAVPMRQGNFVTLGDFFARRFGKSSEAIAMLVSIPTSLMWAAAQLVAFAMVLKFITGSEMHYALILATMFVVVYTMLGGMLGDVIHDTLQGGIVAIGLIILLAVMLHDVGGASTALAMIKPAQLSLMAEGENFWARLDAWMVPVLGSLVAQEMLGRMLSTRNASIARAACFGGAALYLVLGLIPVIIGLVGAHVIEVPADESFILTLAQHYLSPALLIIFYGALLAAILSTIDSTLLSAGAMVSHNLLPHCGVTLQGKAQLRAARVAVLGAGLVAYIFASSGGSIYELLQLSSLFGSAGLVVTVLAGLYVKAGQTMAANITLLAGVVATILGSEAFAWEAPFFSSLFVCAATYALVSGWERMLSPSTLPTNR